MSRELAAAQDIATRQAGGRPVPLAQLLGELFETEPERFFSADQFHPSAAGYQACAHVMLPEVLAAVGLVSGGDVPALPTS